VKFTSHSSRSVSYEEIMPELIPMPKLGFDMTEGTLVRKVKKEGEAVNKGEILAEIETDKATVEVEAYIGGVVKGWLVEEGQHVPIGTPMAVIAAADEKVDMDALRAKSGGAAKPPDSSKTPAPKPAEGASQPQPSPKESPAPTQPAAEQSSAPSGTPAAPAPASPLARKIAGDAGVDIRQIPGTGPGGRITKKDVEAFLSAKPSAAAPSRAAAPAVATFIAGPASEDQTIPLTRLRQIIAKRMTESKQTAPQFYVTAEVDMAAAMELRQQINTLLPDERKVSVNDLVVKATALALRAFPNLNASFAGDKVIRKGHVNVGIAVTVEGGLLTVVVKDTDQKSLAQIAAEAKAMAGRAREGKVQGADIEGSTFSTSNLGMYGVDNFIAIVNPPEAGILAFGAVREVPVVKDGALVPGVRMKVTVSADHRVTDGAEAAQFLQAVKKNLEEPLRLVV
jgi:pyruvate dehydrogenase E2 component (dihydrolipoamide acetyltransferase)